MFKRLLHKMADVETKQKKETVRTITNKVIGDFNRRVLELFNTSVDVMNYFRKNNKPSRKKNAPEDDKMVVKIELPSLDGKGEARTLDLRSSGDIRTYHTMVREILKSMQSVEVEKIISGIKGLRKSTKRVNISFFSDQYIEFLDACVKKINPRAIPVSDFMNNTLRKLGIIESNESVNAQDSRVIMNLLSTFAKTRGVSFEMIQPPKVRTIRNRKTKEETTVEEENRTKRFRRFDQTFEVLGDDTVLRVDGEPVAKRSPVNASEEDRERVGKYHGLSRNHDYMAHLEGKISYVNVAKAIRGEPQTAVTKRDQDHPDPVYETKIHKSMDGIFIIPSGYLSELERHVRTEMNRPENKSRFYEMSTNYLISLREETSPRRGSTPTRR